MASADVAAANGPGAAVTAVDILQARRRIAPYVRRTPSIASSWLSSALATRVSLKVESLQVASSFKARGAFNAVLGLRERASGGRPSLVTGSAGNHGRGLAMAAETFGLPLVVFTPIDAPRAKLDAIRRHGATLRAEGHGYEEAERMAKAFAAESGATFISPYSDADVIAGAGTIALEMFEDAADLDTLVVPIGGGGLVSGVGIAAKSINPACHVIGVEVEASCPFHTSVPTGRLTEVVVGPTLADGLAGNPDPDTITFGLIQRYVDEIVKVSEDELARAVVGLVGAEHLVVEGAAAVGVAAMLAGRIQGGSHVGVVLSGANIDRERLAGLLSRTSLGPTA